jgi:hypothetical protein
MDQDGASSVGGPTSGASVGSATEVGGSVPISGELLGNIHRIGGATVDNLRLKPREAALDAPGISVIKAPTAHAAASEIRAGFPRAKKLHELAKTVGTANEEGIRSVGFDVIPAPSVALPNHHRIIHPDGADGFTDANLGRLAEVFRNSTGH